jgi:hypothetical protein
MSKYNDNFPEIFTNLKDGDCLGFYRGGIFKYFIPLATGGDCNHVGICYNVKREGDILSFNFSQQTFYGGSFDIVKIYKTSEGYITENPYFIKQDIVYYRQLRQLLTEQQKAIGIADSISQVGKKYGYLELALGFEFLEQILPRFVKDLILRLSEHWKRVCSTHCAIQYSKMGLIELKKDFFYTPIEILKLLIFK